MNRFGIILIFLSLLFPTLRSQTVYINGIPRDTSFTVWQTYVKQKKYFPDIKIVRPELPDGVIEKDSLVYSKVGKRELHLNMYRPDDGKKYPALIMIHGGGWNSGDLTLQIPMAMKIAAQGYVTIPIEYRLIPEAVYPAGINDVKAAVRWVRTNAKKYGIDPNKIAISGCSAGGQLAMLAGTTNGLKVYEGQGGNNKTSSDIQAIINIDGISTFIEEESIINAEKARKSGGKMPVNALWLGGTYQEQPQTWEQASALYWVSKKSAPVCFINSAIPRFHNGRDETIQKLNDLGIYSEVHTIDNTPHPFWLFHLWFQTTVDYMVNFLNKTLK